MKKKLIRKVCVVIFGMMVMTFISCKQNEDEGGSSSSSPSNGFEKDRYEIIAGNTAEIDVDTDGDTQLRVLTYLQASSYYRTNVLMYQMSGTLFLFHLYAITYHLKQGNTHLPLCFSFHRKKYRISTPKKVSL